MYNGVQELYGGVFLIVLFGNKMMSNLHAWTYMYIPREWHPLTLSSKVMAKCMMSATDTPWVPPSLMVSRPFCMTSRSLGIWSREILWQNLYIASHHSHWGSVQRCRLKHAGSRRGWYWSNRVTLQRSSWADAAHFTVAKKKAWKEKFVLLCDYYTHRYEKVYKL